MSIVSWWATRRLHQQLTNALWEAPWVPLTAPRWATRGWHDTPGRRPNGPRAIYYPSPYDMPTAVKHVRTAQGWLIAWRFIDDEPLRRVSDGGVTWLMGRHSGRLYGVMGPPSTPVPTHPKWPIRLWGPRASQIHKNLMQDLWAVSSTGLNANPLRGITVPVVGEA